MDDIREILKPQYEYINNLDQEEKDIILNYTKDGYRELNENLRKRKLLSLSQERMMYILDNIFNNIQAINEPIIVYRGGNYIPDSNVDSFISTSLDINVPLEFIPKTSLMSTTRCCLMEILISPGSKVLPIEKLSDSRYEHEILLPRTGTFMLTNVTTINHRYYNNLIDTITKYQITYVPNTVLLDYGIGNGDDGDDGTNDDDNNNDTNDDNIYTNDDNHMITLDNLAVRLNNLVDKELITDLRDVGYDNNAIYEYLLSYNHSLESMKNEILTYLDMLST